MTDAMTAIGEREDRLSAAAMRALSGPRTPKFLATRDAAGIPNVWVHQSTETPEALQEAEGAHLRCEHGTCAVMYVTPGFTGHSFHRWVMKLAKKY